MATAATRHGAPTTWSSFLEMVRVGCFLLTVVLSCFAIWWNPPNSLETQITACDIGQGDAVIVRHGSIVILIDTGPDSTIVECLSRELPWWRQRVDFLILTHSDWDHIGGAESVLGSFSVGEVWRTSWPNLSASGQKAQIALDKIPTRIVQAGESLALPGLRVRVLSGENSYEMLHLAGVAEENANNNSVSTWIQTESFGFLGMGDLECSVELAVVGWSLLTQLEILKISHHGSKTSTCPELLARLLPETAIISSGSGNTYGHPHPFPLENLRNSGVEVLRTDLLGTFTLVDLGQAVRVQAESSVWNQVLEDLLE